MDAHRDEQARTTSGDAGDDERIPVQHCPFCGESVGSFWGRRGDDGSHWCESCQLFFRVEVG
jgi:hypothetical protein